MPDHPYASHHADDRQLFGEGQTVIRRDVHAGRVWTASAHRVLADDGTILTLAYWPGLVSWAPSPWAAWTRDRDPLARAATLPALVGGLWDVEAWTWRETAWMCMLSCTDLFSINLFTDPATGPKFWYLNFQDPYRRTPAGVDTFDLFLDLVISPDLTRSEWKDQAEYDQARRLGIIDDTLHHQIDDARERALHAAVHTLPGIAHRWTDWRPDPAWPQPVLTDNALTPPPFPTRHGLIEPADANRR